MMDKETSSCFFGDVYTHRIHGTIAYFWANYNDQPAEVTLNGGEK